MRTSLNAIIASRRQDNDYQKEKYAQNKRNGTCAYCGKRPPLDPFVSCEGCRTRHRHYSLLFTKRQREMRRQGLVQESPDVSDAP